MHDHKYSKLEKYAPLERAIYAIKYSLPDGEYIGLTDSLIDLYEHLLGEENWEEFERFLVELNNIY